MSNRNTKDGSDSTPVSRLLTVKQAAVVLACSPRSVWRLVSLGHLSKVQVGRGVRIPTSSVEAFIATGGAK